ncbi:hypothetical protein GGR74_000830 [Xanthomonas arboricola]
MSKSAEFTIELLKKALDREFGERDSYADFENGHVRVDLSEFLASEDGRKAFEEEAEAAQSVPEAPSKRYGLGR